MDRMTLRSKMAFERDPNHTEPFRGVMKATEHVNTGMQKQVREAAG